MNRKAAALGMDRSRFADPTGLSSENVSTARDLALMVRASAEYPLIREFTTQESHFVEVNPAGRVVGFNNSNPLVSNDGWQIQVSKTGFIREAGKCLVMLANIASRPVAIVLLDSFGRYTRVADAVRVKHWIETGEGLPLQTAAPAKARPSAKVAAPRPGTGARSTAARAVYKQPARASASRVKADLTRR